MLKRQQGVSIVELMIGLTIGILMLSALTALLVNNTQGRAELDASMQQIENGRYATQLVASELRHAGYYGEGVSEEMAASKAPAALPNPCLTSIADLQAALPIAVQGYSQSALSPVACLDNANFKPGTDVLVIRRALTNAVDAASLNPTAPYIQTMGTTTKIDSGSNAGAFSLTTKAGAAAPIHPYTVQIYFVSPCSRPANGATCAGSVDDNGFPRPTLKRMELTGTGWTTSTLVEGIDQFTVEYGIDNEPSEEDKDGAPNIFTTAPATTADWANVVSIRVHILARNTRVSSGHKDEKIYNLGTMTIGPLNDNYRRHVYSEMVRLINISGRREKG